jgi:hypothetical protein
MKLKANKIRLQYNENREAEIVLSTRENIQVDVAELKNVINKGKELIVEIKQYRHKRSLDSNAYMWLLLNEMASILNTTKDELYIQVLDRYGVFTHVVVKQNVVDRVKQEWRTVRELGEVTINGKTGIQLQCYFGSSTYDTKEMSILLNGVVQEAKGLGINTMTPSELSLMNNAWASR